jgi:hypothetical protein
MTTSPGEPALTVVFMTPDSYDTIRRTMRHVRAQTARDRLEVMILAPSLDALGADDRELAEFRWVRLLETGAIVSDGALRARAVREAHAPVVVFTEDHCFPDPEWAAALIEAHEGGWAAVGPVVRNANPETVVSWADLLIGYGPWLAPGEARTMTHLPGHNSSYKVEPLRAYGDELDELMDAETVLQWDLRRRGHELYLEPRAQVAHTNFAFWSLWVPIQIYGGRVFADTRRRDWSAARRLAFAAASPIIPLVRLQRIVRDARRSGVRTGFLARVLPTLIVGLILDGVGQMLGYALGPGRARERIVEYHFHRNERGQQGERVARREAHPRRTGSPA